jgi:transportin-3
LHPFYQNVAPALDIESLFEVTEGVANIIQAQPLNRIYEVMGSFLQPIITEIIAIEQKDGSANEKELRKVAGMIRLDLSDAR